jgi:hypothetical protein
VQLREAVDCDSDFTRHGFADEWMIRGSKRRDAARLPGMAPQSCSSGSLRLQPVMIAITIGCCAAYLAWPGVGVVGASDFDPVWFAARALLSGGSPYGAVGPGRAFEWPFPLLYPLPAVLVAAPFTALPHGAAGMVFSGVSAGLMAWALTRDAPYRLSAVLSFSFLYAAAVSQWSPLLVASALLPGLGFLLVAKPTIGLALWLYRPRWQTAVGGAALLAISVAIRPQWPLEWIHTFGAASHIRPPIASLGGPLILLALLRWRRPEARLLVALACVPHTTLLYEILPLFLVPASWGESILLVVLTWVVQMVLFLNLGPLPDLMDWTRMSAAASVALIYLPCLIMVLRRPNEGELPAWIARVGARVRTVPRLRLHA